MHITQFVVFQESPSTLRMKDPIEEKDNISKPDNNPKSDHP